MKLHEHRYSYRRGRRSLGLVLGLLALPLLALPLRAQGDEVYWEHYESNCARRGIGTSQALPCGNYGTFYFSQAPFRASRGSCTPDNSGGGPMYGHGTVETADETSGSDWIPCQGASCTTSLTSDWIAVIDWHAVHGWSVAETIRQAAAPSTPRVKLYNIRENGPASNFLFEVGDAHLLQQLCAVAEDSVWNPPTLLNMSFGRSGFECEEENPIGCEINNVLRHLRQDRGVRIVGAAGNHSDYQYPAHYPTVIGVGAVDLQSIGSQPVPTPYTPPRVEALFPAYGLVLEESGGAGLWAAPPGSSYAAAILTGWLARVFARTGSLAFLDGVSWVNRLSMIRTDAEYSLSVGGVPVPNTESAGASRLIGIAIGDIETPFLGLVGSGTVVAVTPSATSAPAFGLSFADLNRDQTRPSPDSEPCVPCRLQRRRRSSLSSRTGGGDSFVLDLSGSGVWRLR